MAITGLLGLSYAIDIYPFFTKFSMRPIGQGLLKKVTGTFGLLELNKKWMSLELSLI